MPHLCEVVRAAEHWRPFGPRVAPCSTTPYTVSHGRLRHRPCRALWRRARMRSRMRCSGPRQRQRHAQRSCPCAQCTVLLASVVFLLACRMEAQNVVKKYMSSETAGVPQLPPYHHNFHFARDINNPPHLGPTCCSTGSASRACCVPCPQTAAPQAGCRSTCC